MSELFTFIFDQMSVEVCAYWFLLGSLLREHGLAFEIVNNRAVFEEGVNADTKCFDLFPKCGDFRYASLFVLKIVLPFHVDHFAERGHER